MTGCRLGSALFMFYLATLGYYLYVRLTSTLNLGLHYQWYAERMQTPALSSTHYDNLNDCPSDMLVFCTYNKLPASID